MINISAYLATDRAAVRSSAVDNVFFPPKQMKLATSFAGSVFTENHLKKIRQRVLESFPAGAGRTLFSHLVEASEPRRFEEPCEICSASIFHLETCGESLHLATNRKLISIMNT